MLLLVFVLLTLGLFALFLGGSLVAQGYLYQAVAARIAVRALGAAVLVGGFITLWLWIDKGRPGRYDTFFNFAGESTAEFSEFEAVRWTRGGDGKMKFDADGKPVETLVRYKRTVGGKGEVFADEQGRPFQLLGSTTGGTQFMTGAIRVKAEGDAEPVRYNAELKDDPRSKGKTYINDERRFLEEKGSRYLKADQLGTLFVPSTGAVVVALLLNLMLFVVWLGAFWPILRFALGHAIVLASVATLITMLAVMPLLFKTNRAPNPPPKAAARLIAVRQWESA